MRNRSPLSRGRGLLEAVVMYLSSICLSYAQGGPPMLTDDPGTPGAGQWEINMAVLEERTATVRSRSVPHVDINYGWGDRVQRHRYVDVSTTRAAKFTSFGVEGRG